MSSPNMDLYRMILTCTIVDEIVNIINQLQAMSFNAAPTTTPPAMPFMAACELGKQVLFSR